MRNKWAWLGFAAVLLAAPWVFASSSGRSMLGQMGIAAIACLSYNLLLGQGGMLSFGHAVYTGLGAFATLYALNAQLLPVSLLPLVGGAAGVGVALLLGWVSCQRSATTFAMVTLGLGELVAATAWLLPEVFGGEAGVAGNRVTGTAPLGISFGPPIQLYYLVAAYTFACTGLVYGFTRTPLGRILNAVRDNPERAEFVGVDARWVRFLAVVVAGFFAGIAGGLAALHFEIATADVLGAQRSGAYLLFTVLGGTGVFWGPLLGGVLMVLALVLLSGWTPAWLLYVGLVFMGMVMAAPGGVASLLVRPQGSLRSLGARWAAGAVMAAGGVALVEMLYHLQLRAALGPGLRLMGWTLDVDSPASWGGAGLVLLAGAGLFTLARRLP